VCAALASAETQIGIVICWDKSSSPAGPRGRQGLALGGGQVESGRPATGAAQLATASGARQAKWRSLFRQIVLQFQLI
jgi:hypothetical protein